MATTTVTPLLALLRAASPKEREQIAKSAGTNVQYLYQLAGCSRRAGLELALGIERASTALHGRTEGRTPIVTAVQLARMKRKA